ncbi:MAG TPA: hypothetical protein VGB68_13745 [Pyrinomonadaceae bacterium]|jgi:hypothetical protein
MKKLSLVLLLILTSCSIAQNQKPQESINRKFFDSKNACQFLANVGLDQGEFGISGNSEIPNRYMCLGYKFTELKCTSDEELFEIKNYCNRIEYKGYGVKDGVVELKLTYFGGWDDVGHDEDIQIFIKNSDLLISNSLKVKLEDEAKKKILETFDLKTKNQGEIYRKKYDSAVLSIYRSVMPFGGSFRRKVEFTIYADEYWSDYKNVEREWKVK